MFAYALLLSSCVLVPAEVLQATPPAHSTSTPVQNEERPQDEPATADELLALLEEDGKTLRNFRASFYYRKTSLIQDDDNTVGELVFDNGSTEEPHRRFAMIFKAKISGNQRRDRDEVWVFDGEWFVERNNDLKQIVKRQVVAPGEAFDPFSLREGVFPMPVGQKKDDVLSRFDAEMITLDAGGAGNFLSKQLTDDSVFGLKLTPKPGTPAAEEFTHVHLFFDRQTLLPAGVDIFKANGNRDTAWLARHVRNGGLDESVFDTTLPDGAEWKIDVQP